MQFYLIIIWEMAWCPLWMLLARFRYKNLINLLVFAVYSSCYQTSPNFAVLTVCTLSSAVLCSSRITCCTMKMCWALNPGIMAWIWILTCCPSKRANNVSTTMFGPHLRRLLRRVSVSYVWVILTELFVWIADAPFPCCTTSLVN